MTDLATVPTTTPVVTPDPKPGYKTSEFWLALAAMFLTALFASGAIASGGSTDKVLTFAAAALTSLGYSVSRGLAKSGK
jgi:hypothetical protein